MCNLITKKNEATPLKFSHFYIKKGGKPSCFFNIKYPVGKNYPLEGQDPGLQIEPRHEAAALIV